MMLPGDGRALRCVAGAKSKIVSIEMGSRPGLGFFPLEMKKLSENLFGEEIGDHFELGLRCGVRR